MDALLAVPLHTMYCYFTTQKTSQSAQYCRLLVIGIVCRLWSVAALLYLGISAAMIGHRLLLYQLDCYYIGLPVLLAGVDLRAALARQKWMQCLLHLVENILRPCDRPWPNQGLLSVLCVAASGACWHVAL